jgi:hypothetical protein
LRKSLPMLIIFQFFSTLTSEFQVLY